nr:hypothetical protein [uncultured Blautia sp.]
MNPKQILKNVHCLLDWKQKITFLFIMLIMILSSVLTQLTPKAIGWLTDDILSQAQIHFSAILPILFFILKNYKKNPCGRYCNKNREKGAGTCDLFPAESTSGIL